MELHVADNYHHTFGRCEATWLVSDRFLFLNWSFNLIRKVYKSK